eukprot:jgi/Astpho2/8970/Aster-02645
MQGHLDVPAVALSHLLQQQEAFSPSMRTAARVQLRVQSALQEGAVALADGAACELLPPAPPNPNTGVEATAPVLAAAGTEEAGAEAAVVEGPNRAPVELAAGVPVLGAPNSAVPELAGVDDPNSAAAEATVLAGADVPNAAAEELRPGVPKFRVRAGPEAAGAPKPKPPVLAAAAAEEAGKLNPPGLAGAALAAALEAAPGQLKPPELLAGPAGVVAAAELPKPKLKPPEAAPAPGREVLWGPADDVVMPQTPLQQALSSLLVRQSLTQRHLDPQSLRLRSWLQGHWRPRLQARQMRRLRAQMRQEHLDKRLRQGLETRREQLQKAVSQQKEEQRRQKYAQRYQKVRFFERVKLERRIKHLQRQLHIETGGAGTAEQQAAELHQAQEDLQYVLHFPRTEKYVSLLKTAPDAAAQEQLEAERARLRGLVKQHLAEVAMLTQGDEGRSTLGGQPPLARSPPQTSPPSGAPLSGAKRKQAESHEHEDVDMDASSNGSEDEQGHQEVKQPQKPASVARSPGSTTGSAHLSSPQLASRAAAAPRPAAPGTAQGTGDGHAGAPRWKDQIEDDPFFASAGSDALDANTAKAATLEGRGTSARQSAVREDKPHQAAQNKAKQLLLQLNNKHMSSHLPAKPRQAGPAPSVPGRAKGNPGRPPVVFKSRPEMPVPTLARQHRSSDGSQNKLPSKPDQKAPKGNAVQPLRTRAEGGRKRRRKH